MSSFPEKSCLIERDEELTSLLKSRLSVVDLFELKESMKGRPRLFDIPRLRGILSFLVQKGFLAMRRNHRN